MSQRQHPAGLFRLYAAAPGAVNHPATRLDFAPDQALQGGHIEVAQQLGLDAQHQRAVHFEPQTTTIALHTFDLATNQGEATAAQIEGRDDLVALPEAEMALTGSSLRLALTTLQPRGRLEGHPIAQALGQQLRFQIATGTVVGMRQGAAIVIARLGANTQTHATIIGRHQRLQAPGRCLGEGLGGAPVARPFRRVDADQPDAAAIDQAQGIAIHHLGHALRRQIVDQRAEGLGRGNQADRNEKGAHQGRLFQQRGLHHYSAYLLPNTPKRCLKRSIRPPVSSIFCLPV